MSKLIDKVVQKIAVDYCRLSIVGNTDGFLAQDAVRSLIYQQTGIEVITGTNLQLRMHFELEYKQHSDKRYIYVSNSVGTMLVDMRKEAYVTDFAVSDVFPLFSDKSLINKQTYEVLDRLYDQVSLRRISMSEGKQMILTVQRTIEDEKRRSGDFMRSQIRSLFVDWRKMPETMAVLSSIIAKAIKEGVYDYIEDDVADINQGFQTWLDSNYFAAQNSNPLLKAKCVNKILPHLVERHGAGDKIALVVVDGLAHWQYHILHEYLLAQHRIACEDTTTLAWLPTITMLSRQAIFRGDNPLQEYKQSPESERKLWTAYWQNQGLSTFEIQYLSDKDEFAVNEGVKRLAYVTVEMDEKMHSSTDYKDLCSLTENWCPRITEKIIALRNAGYTIYLTTDHGSMLSHGWRALTDVEKVFLYKDGSRGKRHLIYNNKEEQTSFYERNKDDISLLCHDNWLTVRDNSSIAREGQTIITHGGSHFMEVVVPLVKIERK